VKRRYVWPRVGLCAMQGAQAASTAASGGTTTKTFFLVTGI